jgi:hypothetical protein
MATESNEPGTGPEEAPIELGAIRPSRQPGFDARIAAIMTAARPQLEALSKAGAGGDSEIIDLPALSRLRSLRRPVLAIAGLATAAGLALMLLSGGTPQAGNPTGTFASAAGVPAPLAAWAEQGSTPTTSEIVTFLETP